MDLHRYTEMEGDYKIWDKANIQGWSPEPGVYSVKTHITVDVYYK